MRTGSINPSEGQTLMRRKKQQDDLGSNSDGSLNCSGLTSRPNRSMVGHRVNGDVGSKPTSPYIFVAIETTPKIRKEWFYA